MKRRTNATAKVDRGFLPKHRLIILVCFALSIFLNSFASDFKQPATLKELLALSPADLEKCDIARMNLLCAEGLPGAENLSVQKDLAMLDQWAQHIKSETDRNFHHYLEDPAYYYNSTNFYKMLMMAVVLYEDYHIRYNPKWMQAPTEIHGDDHFAADSRDLLINGLIGDQRMGTCSSMPIIYIALARRLGYPVKLVTTKEHLFIRWDSPVERFDMDATGKGLDKYDDDFYKKFPFPITEQEIKEEGYLRSLSPTEELSIFLSARGSCLIEAGRLEEAEASFKSAYLRAPNWKHNQMLLATQRMQQQSTADLLLQKQAMNRLIAQRQLAVNPNLPPDPIPPDPDPMKQMWLRQQQLQNPTMNSIPNQ